MSQPLLPQPMVRAEGRGCLASIVLNLIVVVVVLGLLGIAALAARLAPEGARLPVVAFTFAGGVFVFAIAILGYAAIRAARWDAAWKPLGLAGHTYMISLRRWDGSFQGRSIDATLHKGPLLEVLVTARTATTAALGARSGAGSAFGGALGLTELPLQDPAYAPFIASADDPRWGQALFADPRTKGVVARLMIDPTGRELRSLRIEPGRLRFRRHYVKPGAMSAADNGQMLADLATIASVAESLPAPAQPMTAQQAAARNASGVARVAVVALGVMLLISACLIAPIVAFVIAVSRPASSTPAEPAPVLEPAPDEAPEPHGPRRRRFRNR